ncbi:MAG: ferrochelatase [Alphaproteobacteria bacterium]|nr:ferrochelatase [Alphaproteobacteria bacterium]
MTKTAVILFNLGGPDSKESIYPFLINFFMDKNIIRAPYPVRYLVSRLIASRRTKREAGDSYGELGDKSPLLENSLRQARALEQNLNEGQTRTVYKTFVCMRYWHPMAPEIVGQVKTWNPDHIILLPLYPQYSTTTTRSSFQTWDDACDDIDLLIPTSTICCYPFDNGFISASADNVKKIYGQAQAETGQPPRVLFSAHGLPEDIIRDGDPYQWQCEETARRIAQKTGLENLDWQICYQSRVGPKKWIGPSTEEALEKAAHDQVGVVILPHAFTQEHVETLVEIEIEYREKAHELNVPFFYRVPTVSDHSLFIEGLADIVRAEGYRTWTAPDTGKRLCPSGFCRCGMA